ncbi:MAG: hypothetical protein DMD92_16635 [Candidatus Rokuibacteriota bacterium]|nr:MAG: hypothetical protein DMD92_16635 [Candidatus Rokubacteria bacterium]
MMTASTGSMAQDVRFNIELGRVRDRDPERLAQLILHRDAVARSLATGIFQYWHHAVDGDPDQSDWLFTFYRAIGFWVRLTPRQR